MVIKWCWDSLLLIDNIVVADLVELICADAGFDMFVNHGEYVGSKAASYAHLGNLISVLNYDTHCLLIVVQNSWLWYKGQLNLATGGLFFLNRAFLLKIRTLVITLFWVLLGVG